ncbi:hypothetical protein AB1284_25635 [Bacillus sp. S2(2024)]|uniref:hypothetical protein n=1 Tax=Bacillus sp. S2(2024) TaxID=3162887 RepID=UPI003D2508C8
MTTFIVMVSIFLILFVIGPIATKKKEEKEKMEKELLEKVAALNEQEKVEMEVNGTKVMVTKKSKLKQKVFKIVSSSEQNDNL